MKKVKEVKKEWREIWESEDYKAEIYDNCSTRVYSKEGLEKLKIEVDGTKWVGNSGGFHCYKYFVESDELREIIKKYNDDEASDDDVSQVIYQITG